LGTLHCEKRGNFGQHPQKWGKWDYRSQLLGNKKRGGVAEKGGWEGGVKLTQKKEGFRKKGSLGKKAISIQLIKEK